MATVAPKQVAVPADWIASEVLQRERLAIEPVVMLEEREGEPSVRRLTMAEKLDYADRAGGSVFCGSADEQEEMFRLLDRRADDAQRA